MGCSGKKPLSGVLHKKSIIIKTIQVGGSTLLSRLLAIIREILFFRFFGGPGVISDSFFTAYKIPNSFRKIFAEGALSAAIIPTIVSKIKKGDKDAVNSMMSLAFIVFEGTVLALCAFVIWKANAVVSFIVPGFSPEQMLFTARLLKILMPFIFFISSSALLASVLQSVNRFFVPAISPALLNVVFIISLTACLKFSFPVEYLCVFILCGGLLQFILHLITYFRLKFSFGTITKDTLKDFGNVMMKFLPCLFSMSIVEVSLFVDTNLASYLHKGSVSLIYLSNRFMGIPLGVFAVAFSTILLPHFSRLSIYAPKRISFYLLEATKFVFWVSVPVICIMIFLSENIIYTFFSFTGKFSLEQVSEASSILIAFLFGLFFFSLNKILLNVYYAFHNTWIPTIISIFATVVNYSLNLLLMKTLMATGIALATTISAIIQTFLFVIFLYFAFGLRFNFVKFGNFLLRYLGQLFVVFSLAYIMFRLLFCWVSTFSDTMATFFSSGIGFWILVIPIIAFVFLFIFYTRKVFKVKVYFLD